MGRLLRIAPARRLMLAWVGGHGRGLIAAAALVSAPAAVQFGLALLGWLAIYDCTHSLGHYLSAAPSASGSASTASAAPTTRRTTPSACASS
jgi:hypothetical protein